MWSSKPLGDIVDILDKKRKPITKKNRVEGNIPYYGATGVVDWVRDYIFNEKLVLVGEDGAKWDKGDNTAFIVDGKTWVNNHAHVLRPKADTVTHEWLTYYLTSIDLSPWVTGLTVPKLNQAQLCSIPIPLPPLAEQQRIVEKLDAAFAEIDKAIELVGAKARKAEFLKESLLAVSLKDDAAVREMVKVGEVLKTGSGGTPLKSKKYYYEGGNIKWLLSGAVCRKDIYDSNTHITKEGLSNSSAKLFPVNTVLVAMYGATAGQVGILRTEAATNQAVCGIYPSKDFLPEFLYYYLNYYKETLLLGVSGVAQPNLSQVKIKNIPLPRISLAEQQRIVIKLDIAFTKIENFVSAKAATEESYGSLKAAILAKELKPNEAA